MRGRKAQPSPEQRAVIEDYGKQGYTAERILALDLAALNGFRRHVIREVLRETGHVDLKRSRRTTGTHRIRPELEAKVASFVQNGGGRLPDRIVGNRFGVGRLTALRVRLKTVGRRPNGEKRMTAGTKQRWRKRHDRHCMLGWKERLANFLRLRAKLSGDPSAIPKSCGVCKQHWFETPDFYLYKKTLNRYSATCRLCLAEIAWLKKRGSSNEESRQFAAIFPRLPTHVDCNHERLDKRFRQDTKDHCWEPLRRCFWCGPSWYGNRNYFHVIRDDTGNLFLLNICLKCPA
jgi:hypothetical protein